jgi:hypothetical protein
MLSLCTPMHPSYIPTDIFWPFGSVANAFREKIFFRQIICVRGGGVKFFPHTNHIHDKHQQKGLGDFLDFACGHGQRQLAKGGGGSRDRPRRWGGPLGRWRHADAVERRAGPPVAVRDSRSPRNFYFIFPIPNYFFPKRISNKYIFGLNL